MNLTKIPEAALRSEIARRNAAKRKTFGTGNGRPKKPQQCPRCGVTEPGVVEMRKHKCEGKKHDDKS